MKFLSVLVIMASAALSLSAQTLHVNVGDVTYSHAATQTGDMLFGGGMTLTIQGKTYEVAQIASIVVDDAVVEDNTVTVNYAGGTVKVDVAGNIASLVTVAVKGAHVAVLQAPEVAEKITYVLQGTSENGSFYMDGDYKAGLQLNNLVLTNPDSAAIKIDNGKKIDVELVGASTLSDGAGGPQKACFYIDGHAEWEGSGTLNITGNSRHGYFSDEYTLLTDAFDGSIIVKNAVSDGFHVNQYYEQRHGSVSINAQGDGLDVGVTGKNKENDGQLLLSGGELNVVSTGAASKAVKCDSLLQIAGGSLVAEARGDGLFDEVEDDTKSAACVKAGTDLVISGGSVTAFANGSGGKGLSSGGTLTISDGAVSVETIGTVYVYGKLDSKPQGVKADEDIVISGGSVFVAASPNKATALKPTKNLLVDGGKIMAIGAKASTPAVASKQASYRYSGVAVAGGSTLTLNGVSFDIPSDYTNSGAYVLVSSPE